MELGNFAAAGLVFGQLVNGKDLSVSMLFTGLIFTFSCYIMGYLVSRKE